MSKGISDSPNTYPRETYLNIWESQSAEFRNCIDARLRTILDAYLTTIGEAKTYADHKRFAATMVDAVLMYAIADGWATLSDKAVDEGEKPSTFPESSILDLSLNDGEA